MHGLPAEADGGEEDGEARHALRLAHVRRIARVHLVLRGVETLKPYLSQVSPTTHPLRLQRTSHHVHMCMHDSAQPEGFLVLVPTCHMTIAMRRRAGVRTEGQDTFDATLYRDVTWPCMRRGALCDGRHTCMPEKEGKSEL